MQKQENLGPVERCACDDRKCKQHHLDRNGMREGKCHRNATCVMVLTYNAPAPMMRDSRYPNVPRMISPRTVRLGMCSDCAAWWTSREHDGVTATYQVQPRESV